MTLSLRFLLPLVLVGWIGPAAGQTTVFSVDWHGPTVGAVDAFTGTPITSGDLLRSAAGPVISGPLPTPGIYLSHGGGGLGLMPGCVGVPGGTPCVVEVDALSFGIDIPLIPNGFVPGEFHFSVDPFAIGLLGSPVPPNVGTEALAIEAPADAMTNAVALPPGPVPITLPFGHRGIIDGDGLFSASGYAYPGLGLVEPCPPLLQPGLYGDNLDALDTIFPGLPPGLVYYSLEGNYVDPLTGVALSGSALAHGFTGADVLFSPPGGVPGVYAPGFALGLNIQPGQPFPDDLDGMILWDNGDGIFQPSQVPMDWFGGGTDMLLFSVRRGSPIIGLPDSIFGLPIQEGDVLTTPLQGGASPYPGIFYSGEALGLASVRTGTALGAHSDDLTALDVAAPLVNDCDGDGMEDVIAILLGLVPDGDQNGVPDSCQVTPFCNPAAANSTGLPTVLTGTFGSGTGSGLHLGATQGPPGQFGYFLIGSSPAVPGMMIGQGFLCLSVAFPNLVARYSVGGTNLDSVGSFDGAGVLQNLVGTSLVGSGYDVPTPVPNSTHTITAGKTWHFQLWHRDLGGQSNFSNGVSVTF